MKCCRLTPLALTLEPQQLPEGTPRALPLGRPSLSFGRLFGHKRRQRAWPTQRRARPKTRKGQARGYVLEPLHVCGDREAGCGNTPLDSIEVPGIYQAYYDIIPVDTYDTDVLL